MTVSAQQLTRVFKIGATELPDPAPDEKPEDALRYHEVAYPVLKICRARRGRRGRRSPRVRGHQAPGQDQGLAVSSQTAKTLLTRWARGSAFAHHSRRADKAGIRLLGSDMAARRIARALEDTARRHRGDPGGGGFAAQELPPI